MTTVGGFVFSIICLVLPPDLPYTCFKQTQTKNRTVWDLVDTAFGVCFMIVSTIFSAIALVKNMKWVVC